MKGRPPRQGATNARLAIRQAIQAIKPPRRRRLAATAPRVAPSASPIPPLTRSDALSDLASDTTQCMSNSSFLSDLQQSSSSSSVLLAAVSDVVTNNTSIRRAAVVHGCPRTTLHRAVQAHKHVCVCVSVSVLGLGLGLGCTSCCCCCCAHSDIATFRPRSDLLSQER